MPIYINNQEIKKLFNGLEPLPQAMISEKPLLQNNSNNILDHITSFNTTASSNNYPLKNPEKVLQRGYDYFVNGIDTSEFEKFILINLTSRITNVKFYCTPVQIKKVHILYEPYSLNENQHFYMSCFNNDISVNGARTENLNKTGGKQTIILDTSDKRLKDSDINVQFSLSGTFVTSTSRYVKVYGIYFEI